MPSLQEMRALSCHQGRFSLEAAILEMELELGLRPSVRDVSEPRGRSHDSGRRRRRALKAAEGGGILDAGGTAVIRSLVNNSPPSFSVPRRIPPRRHPPPADFLVDPNRQRGTNNNSPAGPPPRSPRPPMPARPVQTPRPPNLPQPLDDPDQPEGMRSSSYRAGLDQVSCVDQMKGPIFIIRSAYNLCPIGFIYMGFTIRWV